MYDDWDEPRKGKCSMVVIGKEEVEEFDFVCANAVINSLSKSKKIMEAHKTFCRICMEHDNATLEFLQIPEVMRWLNESIHKVPWFYFLRISEDSGLHFFMHAYIQKLAQKKKAESLPMEIEINDAADFMVAVFRNLNTFTDKHGICPDINRELSEQLYAFYLVEQSDGEIYTVGEFYGMLTDHIFTECDATSFEALYQRAQSLV